MCLAVPGRVLSIENEGSVFRSGRVSFDGLVREVNLAYTPEARIDDYVIVHAGFAIAVVAEHEAEAILGYFEQLDGGDAGSDAGVTEP